MSRGRSRYKFIEGHFSVTIVHVPAKPCDAETRLLKPVYIPPQAKGSRKASNDSLMDTVKEFLENERQVGGFGSGSGKSTFNQRNKAAFSQEIAIAKKIRLYIQDVVIVPFTKDQVQDQVQRFVSVKGPQWYDQLVEQWLERGDVGLVETVGEQEKKAFERFVRCRVHSERHRVFERLGDGDLSESIG
ncbi:hypothetical protein BGZ58_008554 [Dissophora ornata]|nr:hypothetical protein BGZ58_008554 [Dissophora ornata]